MKQYLSVITVILLLTGCGGNSSSVLTSGLFGEWKTEVCEFEPDSLYRDPEHWEEVIYNFKHDGRIKKIQLIYGDSTCSGEFIRIEPLSDSAGTTAGNFSDLGAVQLEDGTGGGRLQLRLSFLEEKYTYEGFYSISEQNNKICFSGIFNFGIYAISPSIDSSTAIDYENCLVRVD